jgi:hypothetical protein
VQSGAVSRMSTIDPLECYVGLPTNQLSSNYDGVDPHISKIGGQPVRFIDHLVSLLIRSSVDLDVLL